MLRPCRQSDFLLPEPPEPDRRSDARKEDAKEVSTRRDATAGAILAGGKSSRMGQDKALLPLHGIPMIRHIATAMQSVVPSVCIVSDRSAPYRFLNLPVCPDLVKEAGPLGGIHAALTHLGAPAVLVSGCDTPYLTTPLFRHLLETPHRSPALVARAADGVHPLCGIYHREALPVIEQFLGSGRFKLLDLLAELQADTVAITPDLPFFRPGILLNVNDTRLLQQLNDDDTRGMTR